MALRRPVDKSRLMGPPRRPINLLCRLMGPLGPMGSMGPMAHRPHAPHGPHGPCGPHWPDGPHGAQGPTGPVQGPSGPAYKLGACFSGAGSAGNTSSKVVPRFGVHIPAQINLQSRLIWLQVG